MKGVNIVEGTIVYEDVADAFGMGWSTVESIL